ncbi:hypothetical protein BC629DRAFT_1600427 [Irpex lacteus]|nr:hypothetical protein BC629DRAFT_1600427 [Irpex lacteus]
MSSQEGLTPFANTQTSYCSSSQLKSTDVLGFTYREIMVERGNETDAQREVAKRIETLYGSGLSTLFSRLDHPQATALDTAEFKSTSTATNLTDHSVYDWKVRVRVNEFALGESFQVLIFLGPVPPLADYKDWMSHPDYVGCVSAFVSDIPELHANAARPENVIQGIVYLSQSITEKSGLPGSLAPDVVSPYLEEKLSWSVRKVMGGVPVPLEDVPSLEVTVFSTLLTKQEGSPFPQVGETVHHHHITHGKVGGHRATEEEEA